MIGNLYDHLEQALEQLETGEELDSILAAYPVHAVQLKPILQAALKVLPDPSQPVSPEVLNRSRTRILAHANQLRQDQPAHTAWGSLQRLVIALGIALVFLLSWGGLMVTSARTLPGDQLYPAKLTLEKVRLGLTFSSENHKQVEELYQSRRVDEVQQLLELGRIVLVEFDGVVEDQQPGAWLISGIRVRLNPTTVVIGEILPGMTTEVEGLTQLDGTIQASEIHLQAFAFVGYVESIAPQVWQINGLTVQISPDSRISSGLEVGDWVVVEVHPDDFGNLTALLISDTNLPTPTPLPTATPLPTSEPQVLPDAEEQAGSEDDDGQDTGDLDKQEEAEDAEAQDDSTEVKEDDSDHEDQSEENGESDNDDDEENRDRDAEKDDD